MITKVEIGNKKDFEVKEKGYYVQMKWMNDEYEYTKTTAGPFPVERTDLLLEFLNIVQNMINLYKEKGKYGSENYDEIEGYDMYFRSSCHEMKNATPEEQATQETRKSVNAKAVFHGNEYIYDQIMSAKVIYHDGVVPEPYICKMRTDYGQSIKKI